MVTEPSLHETDCDGHRRIGKFRDLHQIRLHAILPDVEQGRGQHGEAEPDKQQESG